MRKLIMLSALLLTVSIASAGCYDARETDDMGYVIAMGLDKGKTNALKITFQLAVPRNIGGGEKGGGGGGETSTILTVEAPTFYSALNMANTFLSRQINLSHAKVIVFSSEIAREGLERYADSLARLREFRPNTYVAVSRNSAEEYLKNVKPEIENNPSKYYELIFRGYNFTALTADTRFFKFYIQLRSRGIQPCAVLAGINRFSSSEDFDLKGSTYKEKGRNVPLEGDFKAGEITRFRTMKSEIMGLAVFNGGKMIGELDGEDTTSHLMITGDFRHAFFTIPDPQKKKYFIALDLKQNRPPARKISMIDGKPHIYVKVNLEADILTIQSGVNYENLDKVSELEDAAAAFIKSNLERYLKKTRDNLRADIAGFGDYFRRYSLTWKEWEDFDWLDKYEEASFDVEVELKVRRPGLMLYTAPTESANEERKE